MAYPSTRTATVDVTDQLAAAQLMAARVVAEALEACGITHAEMARRMGVARSRIPRLLSGEANMTLATLTLALAACDAKPVIDSRPS